MTACSKEATETAVTEDTSAENEQKETEDEKETDTEITTEAETEVETETEEDAIEETQKTSAELPSELSDDLYSFQISIDGTIYQFPMWYSDFEALGWTYDGDNTETLSSNQYSSTEVWQKNGMTIYTSFANLSMNTIPFSECMVSGITLGEFHLKDCDWEIILPGGIQHGVSNADDVKAAYGTPTRDYDGEYAYSMTYTYDNYRDIDIDVDKETNTISKIQIRNITELEGADNSVDSTVPDSVKNYKAPSSLGDDYYSNNIELEGALYTLPCPVSELVANGFIIDEENSDMEVASDSHGWVTFKINNPTVRTMVQNYADYATVIENCFVTSLECDNYFDKIALTLPGSISVGSSEDDVLKAIEDFNYEKELSEGSSYSYTYYTVSHPDKHSYNNHYIIQIEDGVVVGLEVKNDEDPDEK